MSCFDGGWYSAYRKHCGPTLYADNKTAVTADVLEVGLFYVAACLAVSIIIIIPGFRGNRKWFFLIRSFLALFVLTSILICNFGQEWEVSEIDAITQYRAGVEEEIHAHVAAKIGLRSINITLKTDPEVTKFKNGTSEERINYNERFHWNSVGWSIGRAFFGPNAGRFNQEFREAQRKGTPYPILWIAEYFTIDGEGLRWGRHYLQAGFFSHLLIWCTFPVWIISIALAQMVLFYCGLGSILTGLLLITANLVWMSLRNRNELSGMIPFDTSNGVERMTFTWGWCFWLNLFNGLLCLIMGVIIVVLDFRHPDILTTCFGIDIIQEYELIYDDPRELLAQLQKERKSTKAQIRFEMDSKRRGGEASGSGAGVEVEDEDNESDYEDVSGPSKPQFRRRGESSAATVHRIIGRKDKKLQPRPKSRAPLPDEGGHRKMRRPPPTPQEEISMKKDDSGYNLPHKKRHEKHTNQHQSADNVV